MGVKLRQTDTKIYVFISFTVKIACGERDKKYSVTSSSESKVCVDAV